MTAKDNNITIDKTVAQAGETVTISYAKGYDVTWTVEQSGLGTTVDYTVDENDKSKATFTMPTCGVKVSATATPKQFKVIYNYINDKGEPVIEYDLTVSYGENITLYTAPTRTFEGYEFEFCCWRVFYNENSYPITTFEQANASGGTDTMFTVNFTDDSLTYSIQPHYMTGIEPSFTISEPYAEEKPSYSVNESNNYINVQSTDVLWYIGEYDDSKEFPSNSDDLLGMGESQTFVKGQVYTVCIWVSLHNEYFTVKKTTEGGSLGYVNPIINGVESKWLCVEDDYIMTYCTFTAKQAKTNLRIASGARYCDENGNYISEEIISGYTSIKASVGDKLYLVLTQEPNEGYEFDTWVVNVGDVVVQKDEDGYYIIVNENTTFISPTFKEIQCTVKIDILGEVTEQTVGYNTEIDLAADKTLSDGRVFTGWLYEDEDGKEYLFDNDTNKTIYCNCTVKAYYGTPVTPEFYIKMPIVGETPTYEVYEKYKGTLGEDPYNSDGSGITWYLYDPENYTYTELDKDYVFKENELYNITLCLNLTTSGYAWAKDEDGNLVYPKLNGNSIDYDDEYEDEFEWYSVTYSLYTERYDIIATNGTVLVNTFSANKAGQYDVITATANVADVGKVFDKWVVTGIDTTSLDLTKGELTFTMPANAVTVEATYKLVDYTVTVAGGTTTKQTANYGDEVTVTANAPEGKVFKGWQDASGNIVSNDATYTFTVSSALSLTAVYGDKEVEPDDPTPVDPIEPDPIEPDPVEPDPAEPTIDTEQPNNDGLSGGAIAGIAVGSTTVAGLGGFSLFWFVIKKKKFSDLIAVIKGIFKK